MTKEEARKSLFNTKVYVDGKSKEIQEKVFELGFKRHDNTTDVCFLKKPFLFFDNNDYNGYITYTSDMEYFSNSEYHEVSADYILNLKWKEEFKDGDVLSYSDNPLCVFIYKSGGMASDFYCGITSVGKYFQSDLRNIRAMTGNEDKELLVLASEEQKNRLFSKMKRLGKRWNAEKKCIEDIKKEYQFKPFDRVLVRNYQRIKWSADIFSYYDAERGYVCTCNERWIECIPYEGNEELLGTTNSPKK